MVNEFFSEDGKPLLKPVNLKLKAYTKSTFKKKVKDRGYSMQGILELFVELYNRNPDIFKIKMEMNTLMFPQPEEINGADISYREAEFDNFVLRRVVKGEEVTDEYHLKVLNKLRLDKFANYMQQKFQGCEVQVIDPDNLLNLEYHISVIVTDELIKDSMEDAFRALDENIIEALNKEEV